MQSKFLLSALLFSAASIVTRAQRPNPPHVSKDIQELNSYRASEATNPAFLPYSKYIESASLENEEAKFISEVQAGSTVNVPAFVTALPSSIRGFASSYLGGEASIIKDLRIATRTSLSTVTQSSFTSSASGTTSNSTSSAPGNSTTTEAPTLSPTVSGPSAQNTTLTATSASNTAVHHKGIMGAAGALMVGVIGMVLLM